MKKSCHEERPSSKSWARKPKSENTGTAKNINLKKIVSGKIGLQKYRPKKFEKRAKIKKAPKENKTYLSKQYKSKHVDGTKYWFRRAKEIYK